MNRAKMLVGLIFNRHTTTSPSVITNGSLNEGQIMSASAWFQCTAIALKHQLPHILTALLQVASCLINAVYLTTCAFIRP